jgi:hypothetical protein
MLPPQKNPVKGVKGVVFRLITVAFGVLLAVAAMEVCVRLFIRPELWRFWDGSTLWQLDPELGWTNKPNLNLTRRSPHEGNLLKIRTNPDGVFPGTAKREKARGVLRILMFGDSGVAGIAVTEEQKINAELERRLKANGVNAEVINAGVEGYSTDQEVLFMRRLVPLYRPDIVTLEICNNDFGGNAERTDVSGLAKPVFVLKADGNLEEIRPDMSHSQIRSQVGGPFRLLIVHSALYRLLQPHLFKLRARHWDWNQRNMLGLASEMYYRPEALRQVDWKLFAAELKKAKETSGTISAKFICYLHPGVEEVWAPYIQDTEQKLGLRPGTYDRYAVEREVRWITSNGGIPFCPLIDYFLANEARGPFHLLPTDPHCNASGYQLQAEELGRFIMERHSATSAASPATSNFDGKPNPRD